MRRKKKIMILLIAFCLIVPTTGVHAATANEEETMDKRTIFE